MRVGVIGAGFVGSALINALLCEVTVVDPVKSEVSLEALCAMRPDAIFVCVPTPSNPDGSVDASIVHEVVSQIPPQLLVVIKSTVTPDHLITLSRGRRIVYNPEFLTQRSANQDFLNSDSLIFGGEVADCEIVQRIYRQWSRVRACPVFITDIATASLVKYTLNCIFANKVMFMNQIYQLHQQVSQSSWEEFTNILAADARMGPTHLQVPGPDGQFGFGGACFPKDTKALLSYADGLGVNLSVLRQAVEANQAIRG